jgi:phage gp46-like protein
MTTYADKKLVEDSNGNYAPKIGTDGDWEKDEGMETAIRVITGTDARVDEYEEPDAFKRRGWIGDEHSVDAGYSLGSKAWLKEQSRNRDKDKNELVAYNKEALDVLVPDYFKDITVAGTITSNGVRIDINSQKYKNKTENVNFELVNKTGV